MGNNEERNFAKAAHPLNWYEVAKLMHDNATHLHNSSLGSVSYLLDGREIIERKISNRPVFLLGAFAMENLIKAFLVYENPEYIKGGKLSRELLNKHKLSELQKKCKNIPSPKRTSKLLQVLEEGVNSWARYPCAISAHAESIELDVTHQLWENYNKVFDLYSRKLEELLSKEWKDPYGDVGYVTFKKNL